MAALAFTILLGVGMGTAGAATNDVSALLQQGLFEEEANQNLDAAIQAYQAVVAQTDKNRQFAATAVFRLGECYRKESKTNEAAAQYQRILREFPDQAQLAKLSQQNLAGMGMSASQTPSPDNSDAILWTKVKDLPVSELERVLPTLAPDPVLTTLLQDRNKAEIELASFTETRGTNNPDVRTAQAELDAINKQLWDKIGGIMQALKLRAELSGTSGSSLASSVPDAARQKQQQLLEEEIKVVEQQLQSQQTRVNQGVMSTDELAATQKQLLELKRQLAALQAGQPISATAAPEASDEDKELDRIQGMMQNTPDLITGSSGELVNAAKNGELRVATFLLDHGANINGSQADARPLVHAAAQDQKTMVDLLLGRGADINVRDNWGETALIDAAEHGYKSVVEVLLAHHAELNSKRPDGNTALHMAAQKGFADIAGMLITNGADMNAADDLGQTPLHSAAENGNSAVMQLLIDHKAAVEARNKDGDSPLMVAVQNSQAAAAALLLKSRANVNAKDNDGWTPLHSAVRRDDAEMVKLLLENHADLNATVSSFNFLLGRLANGNTVENVTPLMMAVMRGRADVVKLLLAHKADVNAKDPNGNTPLLLAMINPANQSGSPPTGARPGFGGFVPGNPATVSLKDQLDIVGALLDNGADVNAQNNVKQSALDLAVDNNSPEMVKLILARRPQVDILNNLGSTPLQHAALEKQADIAGLLLDAGADVNAQNKNQSSALSMAVDEQSPEMVKLILAHKPQVDILNYNGWTPLQQAVSEQHVIIAGLLLDAGADPNRKYPAGGNFFGNTPLILAVALENKDLVEILLAHHADPNAPANGGETPLSIAKNRQNDASDPRQLQVPAIIDLLLKAGANENLHRLSVICVSRKGADYAGGNYTKTAFLKGTNSFNHYSLFQLLVQFYAPPLQGSPNVMPGLAFPDFSEIKINRLQKDGHAKTIAVDAETALQTGDCSQDVPLEWGDQVDIPETDHRVGETWTGLSDKERQSLWKCLGGKVNIVVKGQTNTVLLNLRFFHPSERGLGDAYVYDNHCPAGFDASHGTIYSTFPELPQGPWSFWLHDVVYSANVILTSSDLSRVKVIRKDAASRKPLEMTFDLEKSDPANALWLKDGDVIEIPEKP